MNGKTKKSGPQKEQATKSGCICQGLGPALSELLQRFGPPEEARHHFASARLEFLKGLRAVLDARIQQVSNAQAKGEKIEVE